MYNILLRSKQTLLLGLLYVGIFVWWILLHTSHTHNAYIFNWSYGLIGLASALYAWRIAHQRWGGFQSTMGKLIILLGVGLFAQWCGLQIWTYYNLIAHVEVPYPSLADVGYFGLVPAYAVAALMLAKVCAVKLSLRTKPSARLIILVVPIVAFAMAFFLFLRGLGFDASNPVKVFFDLAYPIGETVPFAIALVVLLTSNKIIGGKMRSRILYLVFAFFFQFFTEYFFLYQSGNGTYINGGISDLLYATSYTIMGLGLVGLSRLDGERAQA